MQHARIVVTAPQTHEQLYQFDLLDVDGPRHGRRLADVQVPADASHTGVASRPDPERADLARHQLSEYGQRNGYVVIDGTNGEMPASHPIPNHYVRRERLRARDRLG